MKPTDIPRSPLENFVADNKEDYQLDNEFALDDESEDESIAPAPLPGNSIVESTRGRVGSFLRGRRGSSIAASEQRKPRQGSVASSISLAAVSASIHASGTERRMSHSNRDNLEAHSALAAMPSLLKSEHTLATRRMSRTTQIGNEEMNMIPIPEPSYSFKNELATVPQTPATEVVAFEVEEVPDHRATGKIASWRGGIILVCIYSP